MQYNNKIEAVRNA